MKTISIEIPEGKKAEWVDGVLTLVDDTPKDITERIKTLQDAYNWCFDNGHRDLCQSFASCSEVLAEDKNLDLLAYLKLRIITCALNEGWEPKPYQNDVRYYAIMNDQCTDVVRIAIATATGASTPHTLYFKTAKLSEYAATQFKDIYMDFCHKGKK